MAGHDWTDAEFDRAIDLDPAGIVHYHDVSEWRHPRLAPYRPSRGLDARGFVEANVGKVLGGDWDLVRTPFERNNIHRLLHEHFVEGVPWEKTAVFRQFAEEIAAGERRWHWSSSIEEMLQAARGVEELYRDMSIYGYRRNGKTLAEDPIFVSIGRNGELLYNNLGGHHRLSLARILGIAQVPVRVLVRHRLWQDLRDELRRANRPSRLSNRARQHLHHPDLESLVSDRWKA